MRSERRDYSFRLRRWEWLTRLGTPVWDYKDSGHNSSGEQLVVLDEMRALIGQPSLEAIRYLWDKFSHFIDIAAVAGCFYYYHKSPGQKTHLQKELGVAFPKEVALDPSKLSRGWIDTQRVRLAEKWGLGPVSFGVIGNVFSSFEWEGLQSLLTTEGELDVRWCGESFGLLRECSRFLAFADLDRKVTDEQLLDASRQLGAPFLVADSTRGHHLFFPTLFDSARRDKVYAKVGLVSGLGQEHRYLWHSLERGLPTIRVTPGVLREKIPVVSAVVWDKNSVFRS